MVDAAYVPDAGHIIKIDLDPHAGHEQGGWRPALVLSPKRYNRKTGLAVVVPITNRAKGYPFEVPLPERIKTTGVVLADAVRSLDWHARHARYVTAAPPEVIRAVRGRLMALLGFSEA
jgi:mRNA interferase MazF